MSCIICGEPNPCGGSFCPCCDEREQRKIQEEQDFNSALDLANERLIAERDAEIAALREAALDLIDEINKHPISSTISSTSIHYFKRTLSDRCPARPKAKP